MGHGYWPDNPAHLHQAPCRHSQLPARLASSGKSDHVAGLTAWLTTAQTVIVGALPAAFVQRPPSAASANVCPVNNVVAVEGVDSPRPLRMALYVAPPGSYRSVEGATVHRDLGMRRLACQDQRKTAKG